MSAIIEGKEYQGAITMTNDKVFEGREDGTYTEAIPYPLFVGLGLRKAKCECGKKFKGIDIYREHYWEQHHNQKIYKRTAAGFEEQN